MSDTPFSTLARCWAQIDTDALAFNVKALPVSADRVVGIVKADAYGHGVDIVVPVLAAQGVRHWGVATAAEGKRLREILDRLGVDSEIYLIATVLPMEAQALIASRLTPFCCDIQLARALSDAAQAANAVATVHVEVDSGIGRAGVLPVSLPEFVAAVRSLPHLAVTGISSHFTAADALEGPGDAQAQYALFEKAIERLDPQFVDGIVVHVANSPATLRLPAAHRSLIRPGLLIYGIAPSGQLGDSQEVPFPYKPVLSLHARTLLVRRMPAGTDISYNRTYRLRHDATIATIGIGYGDGFPRRLSNRGRALLEGGVRVPMRGRICMDQVCLELPDWVKLAPGEVATLIGTRGESQITALEIADMIDTTPHEVTTCLTARVPRVAT